MLLFPARFIELAGEHFFIKYSTGEVVERRYRSIFGVTPDVTSSVWNLLEDLQSGSQPIHLLWALFFLKSYTTETVNSFIWRTTEKTFRKWVWYFIDKISLLPAVCIFLYF